MLAFFPLINLYIMWAIIVYLLYCDYLFNTLNYAVLFPSMLFCSLVFCISVSFRLLFTLISVVNLAFAACTLFPCLPHLSNIIFLLCKLVYQQIAFTILIFFSHFCHGIFSIVINELLEREDSMLVLQQVYLI